MGPSSLVQIVLWPLSVLTDAWLWFTARAPAIFAVGLGATVVGESANRMWRGRRLPVRAMGLSATAGLVFMLAKRLLAYSVIIPLHLFLYRFRVVELDLGDPLAWLAVFLCRDVMSYWAHRLEHTNRWLWASHAVHHSFEEMSPSCSTRVPWMENLYKIPFSLWMPLLGVDIRMVVGLDALAALISIAQHTEAFPARPDGWLQRVFIVPSHHRVHHGTNPRYLDKNFGAVLCIWDRMFGTFEPETEPVTYGVLGRPLDRPIDMVLGRYPDLLVEVARDTGRRLPTPAGSVTTLRTRCRLDVAARSPRHPFRAGRRAPRRCAPR